MQRGFMIVSNYMHWGIDPVVLPIGPLAIRWYGLLFATGFVIGYCIVLNIYKKEGKPVQDLDSLLLYLVIGTVVGARLGHVLFYDPGYYFSHPLEIIEIWKGGLASHGGAIGVLLAVYLYSRKHPTQPYLWLLDRLAIPVALAATCIRIGNFFNSEILGTPATVPWAIVFDRIDNVPRHPVQLYEAISYAIIFIILRTIYKRHTDKLRPGMLVGLLLTLVFSARFFLEFIKMHQAAYASGYFSVGQWLSIPAVIAGVVLLVWGGKMQRESK
jgi:phosphatidylglycerol:prolipoprotein diacylglycerol transferase